MSTLDIQDVTPTPVGNDSDSTQTTPPGQLRASSTTPGPTAPDAKPVRGSTAWVPVRSMTPRHRPRILKHLLALDQADRYLRFGYPATDAQIAKYVDTLDFDRDELFGIFNRKLELLALAHLAYSPLPQVDDRPPMAEFGVSVMPKARRRRFGARLFENAILHARNRGFETLFIHALSENTPMLKIARNAGAQVVRDGSESEAWLKLPPETVASRLDEVVEHRAAEIDYQWKLGAKRFQQALDVLAPPFCSEDKPGGE